MWVPDGPGCGEACFRPAPSSRPFPGASGCLQGSRGGEGEGGGSCRRGEGQAWRWPTPKDRPPARRRSDPRLEARPGPRDLGKQSRAKSPAGRKRVWPTPHRRPRHEMFQRQNHQGPRLIPHGGRARHLESLGVPRRSRSWGRAPPTVSTRATQRGRRWVCSKSTTEHEASAARFTV